MKTVRSAERVLWVVACAYIYPARTLRDRLEALARKMNVCFQGVIVDNRGVDLPPDEAGWTYVAGSNQDHDFSAYSEGLNRCLEGRGDAAPDIVFFINDSLFALHSAHVHARETMAYVELLRQLKVPALCGKTDPYAAVCHRSPWSGLPFYVSSFCFLLNRPAFDVLRALSAWADEDGLDRDLAVTDSRWGAGLQPNFREFIRAFVAYGGSWFVWPGLQRYAIGDRLISVKARCIYLEHRLSGEIARNGCLIPINEKKLPRLRLYIAEKIVALKRKVGLH